MPSNLNTAKAIFDALKDDKAAEVQIRTEFKTLALQLATDDSKGFEITSSTVNGQTFSGTRSMTKRDRFEMLRMVVNMFDLGRPITSKAAPYFSS